MEGHEAAAAIRHLLQALFQILVFRLQLFDLFLKGMDCRPGCAGKGQLGHLMKGTGGQAGPDPRELFIQGNNGGLSGEQALFFQKMDRRERKIPQ